MYTDTTDVTIVSRMYLRPCRTERTGRLCKLLLLLRIELQMLVNVLDAYAYCTAHQAVMLQSEP